MIESNILHGFLDRLTKEALEEIENGGNLNQQNALPFLIKDQYSKITRMEENFATSAELLDFKQYTIERFKILEASIDARFKEVYDRFEILDKKIEYKFKVLQWSIVFGFTVIGLSQAYLAYRIHL